MGNLFSIVLNAWIVALPIAFTVGFIYGAVKKVGAWRVGLLWLFGVGIVGMVGLMFALAAAVLFGV